MRIKKIAYFDCFAGVSGDMILGALLDSGLPIESLRKVLRHVPLAGYRIGAERVTRAGIAGTKVIISLAKDSGKRVHGIGDIMKIVRKSSLPVPVAETVEKVFESLARAEAKVHGGRGRAAHFHEVGAVDSILDIVGSVAGFHILGFDEIYSSPLPWNSGTVECAHGTLPVPAPAVSELMRGIPVYQHRIRAEMVTPTGAAILKTRVRRFGCMPALRVTRIGYGAGSAQFHNFPNLLRLVIGEAIESEGDDSVAVIETGIDDMSPTVYNYLSEKLFEGGALDVFTTPVLMKKNRPGQLLTVICPPRIMSSLADIIFRESTTLGVRYREEQRLVLPRSSEQVQTPYGRVRVKVAQRPGGRITVSPEYDDCARRAAAKRVSLREVMDAASLAAEEMMRKRGVSCILKDRIPEA
ncbi:MAG: nickel pincer cofactor biosynthesis protein LarC [Candidatus Aureabacteria bacterium]|nr:nickel pincer cofactor biosynthesis protein LarC [Candidatus Auribacterota bacterium]